jgi:4-amino-4-deoxy-L-arabinose transferase-like glycosyltransferase
MPKFSQKESLLLWLLLFSLLLGLLYIFLTPPWQGPDEITHYEFVDILSRAELFKIKHKSDYKLQKEIIHSMDQFRAWKYVYKERPSPLPGSFWSLPLYGGSNTKLDRPPLYYILGSFVLKAFSTDSLLLKHYLIRLLSLLMSLLTILFTYLSAKIVFNNNLSLSLMSACSVALLPEFMIISSSINSDSLANLIGAGSIFVLLFSLHHIKNYYYLLLIPVLVILGLLTGRTTFFVIPSLAVFAVIYFSKGWKKGRFNILLFAMIGLLILIAAFLFSRYVFPALGSKVYTNIMEILGNLGRLFQKDSYSAFNSRNLEMACKSFWYYAGWNAFPLPNFLYDVLKIFSLLGIVGLVKYVTCRLLRARQKHPLQWSNFLLLTTFCILALAGFLLRLIISMDPMARYIFPALPALAILLVIGLMELIPNRLKRTALVCFVFLLVVLNIYALFNTLIHSFYYRFW